MQLVKSTQLNEKELKAIEVLPGNLKPLILALIDSRVLGLEKKEAIKYLFDTLKITELDSGQKNNENTDLVGLSISTYDLIADKFQTLTVAEFKAACKKGVIGDYGEWFGMCLKSVNQWIKGYLNNEIRIKAIKDWNDKISKQETSEVPTQTKIEISKERCKQAFATYKMKGEMPLVPAAYYDLINEWIGEVYNGNKTLVTDPEARKTIVEDVKSRFEKMCIGQKIKSEKRGNHNEAEKLINLVMDPKGNKTLERMTKEAFLKHFFNSLINKGKELEL